MDIFSLFEEDEEFSEIIAEEKAEKAAEEKKEAEKKAVKPEKAKVSKPSKTTSKKASAKAGKIDEVKVDLPLKIKGFGIDAKIESLNGETKGVALKEALIELIKANDLAICKIADTRFAYDKQLNTVFVQAVSEATNPTGKINLPVTVAFGREQVTYDSEDFSDEDVVTIAEVTEKFAKDKLSITATMVKAHADAQAGVINLTVRDSLVSNEREKNELEGVNAISIMGGEEIGYSGESAEDITERIFGTTKSAEISYTVINGTAYPVITVKGEYYTLDSKEFIIYKDAVIDDTVSFKLPFTIYLTNIVGYKKAITSSDFEGKTEVTTEEVSELCKRLVERIPGGFSFANRDWMCFEAAPGVVSASCDSKDLG